MLRTNGDLTMADIARMAGVSESTVSRALAGSNRVAADTRQRIMELASAARYTVNESARSLRLGRTRTVEVLIPIEADNPQHISDPFFLDLLGAIADALTEKGFDLLLSKTPPWGSAPRANSLVSGRADGLIIIGQGKRLRELRDLARAHAQIVVWGAALPGEDYSVIGGDNYEGGRLACAHLIGQGRRRIAFMGDCTLPEIRLRHQGYRDAMRAAGLEADSALVVPAKFDRESAFAAGQALMARAPDVDGVVASSDVIAMGVISALAQAGRRTPQDVGVVGYDDIYSAAWFNPALTTISQSIGQGGEALVEALFARMNGAPAANVLLPARLIVRASA